MELIHCVMLVVTAFLTSSRIPSTNGFSAGVPPLRSVCSDMLPHHHDYKPQSTPAPYEITTNLNTVPGGGDILVTLKSTVDGTKFRGFYLQARDEKSKPIGSFTQNDDAKAHSCNGIRFNSAHHANGKVEKKSVSVTWTAPKDYTGEVIFISTFVKDFVTIWAGIYSEPVSVTPFVKKPRGGSILSLLGGTGDNGDGDGGIAGLISAFGINIPGITSTNTNK